MKASLDTNVIIHLYRANQQGVLFDLFPKGIYVYSFIVDVELRNHGQDIMDQFMQDVEAGVITIIDDAWLKGKNLLGLFKDYFNEDFILYNVEDKGEVYAIALARILGAMSVVTDDTKIGGPHATLMRIPDSEVVPFAFYEVLFLLFLSGKISSEDVVKRFEVIVNNSPELNFPLKSKLTFFVKRFWVSPYSEREKQWMESFCSDLSVSFMKKMSELNHAISQF